MNPADRINALLNMNVILSFKLTPCNRQKPAHTDPLPRGFSITLSSSDPEVRNISNFFRQVLTGCRPNECTLANISRRSTLW